MVVNCAMRSGAMLYSVERLDDNDDVQQYDLSHDVIGWREKRGGARAEVFLSSIEVPDRCPKEISFPFSKFPKKIAFLWGDRLELQGYLS